MDELQQTGQPRGTWLEPSADFWKHHRCYLPPTYFKYTSDRWQCTCQKTYRFDYEVPRWIPEEDNAT